MALLNPQFVDFNVKINDFIEIGIGNSCWTNRHNAYILDAASTEYLQYMN